MAIDWANLGLALQGMGAGFQGRDTSPYTTARRSLSEERKKAAATDAFQAKQLIDQGQVGEARQLLQDRLEELKRTGRSGKETEQLISWMDGGAMDLVNQDLSAALQKGAKYLQPEMIGTHQGQIIQKGPSGEYSAMTPEGLSQAGAGNSTFGSSVTLKDSSGKLFTQTQRRNSQGTMESVVVAMDGSDAKPTGPLQMVGSMGMTPDESILYAGQKRGAETGSAENAKVISGYKKAGLAAKPLIATTKKLIKLNDMISTGKTAPAKKFMANLFNLEDPESVGLGQFHALAGKMILGQIRQLGANPTEGERAFLTSISPGLESGTAINAAVLKDVLEVQQRQLDRGKWFSRNPSKTIDDYLLEEGDFNPAGGEEDEVDAYIQSMGAQ